VALPVTGMTGLIESVTAGLEILERAILRFFSNENGFPGSSPGQALLSQE
jgi:hypothetical protein